MIYSRYLDIHLCTNTHLAALKKHYDKALFFGGSHPYFYEFNASLMQQMRYRDAKNEGFTYSANNRGNCKVLSDVEVTHSDASFLQVHSSFLDTATGESTYALNDELKKLRYVGCMVAIENLKSNKVFLQLAQLMAWISDEDTVNKLRINCHGSGTKTGGMSMGAVELSPDELIDALTRHGLKRASVHTGLLTGLAHAADTWRSEGARWRDDYESNKCQGCKENFVEGIFTSGKHHCRRCGGLFCDRCSAYKADLAVALTGKNTTSKNVRNARVCKKCFDQVKDYGILARSKGVNQKPTETNQTNYGLKTICLACCMGAKADARFSPEQSPAAPLQPGTTFIQDSLAARLLTALRARKLTGIKVTASNQVVADTGSRGIAAKCGITVPTDDFMPKGSQTPEQGEKHAFPKGEPNFTFPAYVWGKRKVLEQEFQQLAQSASAAAQAPTAPVQRPTASAFGVAPTISNRSSLPLPSRSPRSPRSSAVSGGIRVSSDGRCLYFSTCEPEHLSAIKDKFLRLWSFTSWHAEQHCLHHLPGGALTDWTWRLTAPPRVTIIKLLSGVPFSGNLIDITARETEAFKNYKSYEVS